MDQLDVGVIDDDFDDDDDTPFRIFTPQSLIEIEKRIEEKKERKSKAKDHESKSFIGSHTHTHTDRESRASPFRGSTVRSKEASTHDRESTRSAHEIYFTRSPYDEGDGVTLKEEHEKKPDPQLEQGNKLPPRFRDYFPKDLVGKPIEDLDDYYHSNQKTFIVIGGDGSICRFSAEKALFLLSPFNPIRKGAIYTLVHPLFNIVVMLTILVNCIFMAMNDSPKQAEYAFTAIYTLESLTKILARGFILSPFTYLRDAWNWLDFSVITLAAESKMARRWPVSLRSNFCFGCICICVFLQLSSGQFLKAVSNTYTYFELMVPGESLGNIAALRTFRVLRALKTVAVIPGLKTIVGALLEAVRRLRDVIILSIFVLSIFALIGLQLYRGTLRQKCLKHIPEFKNMTTADFEDYAANSSNVYGGYPGFMVCRPDGLMVNNTLETPAIGTNATNSSQTTKYTLPSDFREIGSCPIGYQCKMVGVNPNYGYTNFDSFPAALLCTFRLMTQDFWENLYYLTIRANGEIHMIFFLLVILLGSFYLVNLILAIVAMSYDEQQKQDEEAQAEEEAQKKEEEERRERASMILMRSPSEISLAGYSLFHQQSGDHPEKISIKSDILGNNLALRRLSVARRNKTASLSLPGSPFIHRRGGSFRERLTWKNAKEDGQPRADREPLVLTNLESLNVPFADDSTAVTPSSDDLCNDSDYLPNGRMPSQSSHIEPGLSYALHADGSLKIVPKRRGSLSSHYSRTSVRSRRSRREKIFGDRSQRGSRRSRRRDDTSSVNKQQTTQEDDKKKEESDMAPEITITEGDVTKPMLENSLVCRTPSVTNLDYQDVMILRHLVEQSSMRHTSISHVPMEEISKKQYYKERICNLFCGWTCCPAFVKFQHYVELFILDAFVDMFITICIVLNTFFMAMDSYGENGSQTDEQIRIAKLSNYFFTATFALEAFLKVLALGIPRYVKDSWNIFDAVIVILSLVEIPLENVKGLSVLRSFRLLRVFKLAKSWQTLNMLMIITIRTLGALGNLTFVLMIIIFIFAIMGKELFGENYVTFQDKLAVCPPRWHFKDFFHSFLIVFRVLCGEWIESMWDCMEVAGWLCLPFFLLTVVIGNLVMLNLFLALLLASFSADESEEEKEEGNAPNKLSEAVDRITRFIAFIKSKLTIRPKKGKACIDEETGENEMSVVIENGKEPLASSDSHSSDTNIKANGNSVVKKVTDHHIESETKSPNNSNKVKDGDNNEKMINCSHSTDKLKMLEGDGHSETTSVDGIEKLDEEQDDDPHANQVDVVYMKYPDDCLCACCYKCSPCCAKVEETKCFKHWYDIRCKAYFLVEHKYFETFIIVCILLSSAALAIEDVYLRERPLLISILYCLDKIFSITFILEMLIKWTAFGYKKYFTDAWCWLDFIIVTISVLGLIMEMLNMSSISAFKTMRTLRALRPLRAVSRWEGMRVVVNALIQAIPAIANVMIVCLVFWLIFAIMGVNLFGGKYWKCVDSNNALVNFTEVATYNDCLTKNYTWKNAPVNFDHVGQAYLALLQVATFKGWTDVMYHAVDSSDIGMNHKWENKVIMYLYFVIFIIFGSFFTLNLFIGVIIENFNAMKKKIRGSLEMFMTEDQKKYYSAMKKLSGKQPQKPIPKPRFKLQRLVFSLVTNQKFDIAIMSVIMMNMITMCMEYYDQPEMYTTVLENVNVVFIAVFTVECVLKIFALRWHYFKIAWNNFDFVVVVISVLVLALGDYLGELPISPTLLRVIRVFRVGRVLRLVKSAKGIRTLLFSLMVSLPALFNIGLLLFMVMFIYATFGMSFFMNVKHNVGGIDDQYNFETFWRSVILLFEMCTSAGWDGVLTGISNSKDCISKAPKGEDIPARQGCGNENVAVPYLVSYLIISFLVVINMYIAVILENFSQATEDFQQGLTQDDFDMYYEKWEKYDEKASHYIPLSNVSQFCDDLEEPLNLPLPNYYRIVTLKVTICEDDMVHCVDLLDQLTKYVLGTTDDTEMADISKRGDDYNPISDTMERQRHIYCAGVIQNAWRQFIIRRDENGQGQGHEQGEDDVFKEETKERDTKSDEETAGESRTIELKPDSEAVA